FYEPNAAHANPNGKSKKRPHIGIIPLAWFHRCLIKENNNSETGHNKQDQHREGPLPVVLEVKNHPKESQQEGNIKVAVMGGVVFMLCFGKSALPPRVLNIRIPPDKIPEEIPQVHMIYLVAQKEIEIARIWYVLAYMLGIG